MVRFLYHADVENVADFIRRDPAAPWPADFGITGPLAGPWNRIAFELALDGADVRPRWYNAERALLLWPDVSFSGFPAVESPFADVFDPLPQDGLLAGGYTLARVAPAATPLLSGGQVWLNEAPQCFSNGLCWSAAAFDPQTLEFSTIAYATPNAGFNGVSAARVVGSELWLAAYQGERITVRALPGISSGVQ